MHPHTTDVLAQCHRNQSRRAAADWRASHDRTTADRARPFRRAIGARLVTLGLRLQGSPRRRPVLRGLA